MAFIITLVFIAVPSLILTAASPIPSQAAGLDNSVMHHGRGTWFKPGLGNCGNHNKASDPIVAIGLDLYNRNGGRNCGQWVSITASNGKHAYGITKDSCPGCSNDDLDMSPSLFEKFDSLDKGVLDIKWEFQPDGWSP